MWVQLNGEIVPADEARVSVFDRGFTYGDGVFETFRIYGGMPFALDAHVARMASAARALRFSLPRTPGEVGSDIARVLARNGLGEAVVRIHLSRGSGGRGPGIRGVFEPTWVVAAWPLPADLAARRLRGARLCTVAIRRVHPETLPPVAKLSNYLNSVLVVAEASDRECDDGLTLTVDGFIAECGTANLFFVRDGVLSTPALKLGVIPGITRAITLDMAIGAGLRVEEGCFEPEVLRAASEVFRTNSVLGLEPVSGVDATRYPVPGPVTRLLSERYRERVFSETGGRH